MALKASPIAGLFPPLRPTASTSNRPCTLRVLPLRTSFFGNSGAPSLFLSPHGLFDCSEGKSSELDWLENSLNS